MPMKVTHQAGAAPVALGLIVWVDAPVPVRLGLGVVAWGLSTVNDWDHNNYKRRMHFGAAVVRWTARAGYRLQARNDKLARRKLEADDLHRGPSHSLEWCALVGLAAMVLATATTVLAPWAVWFGLAAFAGTASHVLLDWMTPSGVPLSALYNLVIHREVWRRHACGWWIPFYEVSWWLRWIRLPRPMLVDEKHPGCEPGLFHTDRGGEHMIVVPLLYAATALPALAALGLLGPIVTFLLPWFA